jgi:serine protein kinase
MDIISALQQDFERHDTDEMTIQEYLTRCKSDPDTYSSPAEKILLAAGKPEIVDTSKDPRLSRVFCNRIIKRYPAFSSFYGLEEVIEEIMGYFRRSAQGLEESRQVLYLLGPVGGGKSSIADRIVTLAEAHPIYRIKGSPNNDHPFALFDKDRFGPTLTEEYGIPVHRMRMIPSPWLIKRLKEYKGDVSKFVIEKVFPSKLKQLAISRTEPGDKHNQDVSALVGKTSIRQLEKFEQNDSDSYSYCGALNISNQGVMEFVEMFKASIDMLSPILTSTQEGIYTGTEQIGVMPFEGTILAHSNEAEWSKFKQDKTNEAFIDRIYTVKVPYCLRYDQEEEIYQKLLRNSELGSAPTAPGTLGMLAKFICLTRLEEPENSNLYSKLRVYNGDNVKDADTRAKSVTEYRDHSTVNEGMNGLSTRFAYKILSKVFNFDQTEIAANPVHLLYVLETTIEGAELGDEIEEKYIAFLENLKDRYIEFIGKEIQTAYLDSYSEYGQNIFDRYIQYADFWIQDQEYRDPETGEILDRSAINDDLEKVEKAAGIGNPKDFRNEVVNFVLRARANNNGNNPDWRTYKKLKEVIEEKMFSNVDDMLPIVSFNSQSSVDDKKKHADFVSRMIENGYTEKQVRVLSDWYLRIRKSK